MQKIIALIDDILQDGKDTIRKITGILGTILPIITFYNFTQGLESSSQNIYMIVGFFICWFIFSALTDELDSSLKKVLASIGIPSVIIGLIMVLAGFL